MYSENGTNGKPSPKTGVGGNAPCSDILTDPHCARGDARLVSRMLSLGVVPEEKMEGLLGNAFTMLQKAADEENVRHYASLIRLILDAARLDQIERHKLLDKAVPDQHTMTVEKGAMVRAALDEIRGDERIERISRNGDGGGYSCIMGGED